MVAITTVNTMSFQLILKMAENKVPPITPDFVEGSIISVLVEGKQHRLDH